MPTPSTPGIEKFEMSINHVSVGGDQSGWTKEERQNEKLFEAEVAKQVAIKQNAKNAEKNSKNSSSSSSSSSSSELDSVSQTNSKSPNPNDSSSNSSSDSSDNNKTTTKPSTTTTVTTTIIRVRTFRVSLRNRVEFR